LKESFKNRKLFELVSSFSATRFPNTQFFDETMSTFLVTGAAGFIGFHTVMRLIERGDHVVGIDNLNDYYDVNLKLGRLKNIETSPNANLFRFEKTDLADRAAMTSLFERYPFEYVIHLGAQAGVRHSLENPHAYVDSNLVGFVNVLEGCRHHNIRHLTYASSSSVYGANTTMPFSVHHNVDHPVSLYAATKKSNELLAHTYSHLFGLPTTGLRFFTVYGPWGRPDMAIFKFVKAILDDQPIDVYNNGKMKRDFTYIDDIVEGVVRASNHTAVSNPAWSGDVSDPGTSRAPWRIYNIGNNQPVELLYLIEVIENALGKKAKKNWLPMQPGDVPETCADVRDLMNDVGFAPETPIEEGVKRFVQWHRSYYS